MRYIVSNHFRGVPSINFQGIQIKNRQSDLNLNQMSLISSASKIRKMLHLIPEELALPMKGPHVLAIEIITVFLVEVVLLKELLVQKVAVAAMQEEVILLMTGAHVQKVLHVQANDLVALPAEVDPLM